MSAPPTGSDGTDPFRVGYVRGVTPAKWARIWGERRRDRALELFLTDANQVEVLRDGWAKMAFVRLPVDSEGLNVIPLYQESAVVVVSKEHAAAAVDDLVLADLNGETIYDASGDMDETFALVGAGVGVALVPQSIARLYARRDVTSRPVMDAAPTQIALAWLVETADDAHADAADIQEFIGIVRGRTARSSRGAQAGADAAKPVSSRMGRSASGQSPRTTAKGRSRRGNRPHR